MIAQAAGDTVAEAAAAANLAANGLLWNATDSLSNAPGCAQNRDV